MHDRLSQFSPENLIKDGRLSAIMPGSDEQLVSIEIDLPDYTDHFVWDLANPDNDAFEFASQTVRDLSLPEKLVPRIALSIQRQC